MQFLAAANAALEHHIVFSLPHHLPWRIEVAAMLSTALRESDQEAQALEVVEQGLAAVAELRRLERLDPLPPPPEAAAAYDAAGGLAGRHPCSVSQNDSHAGKGAPVQLAGGQAMTMAGHCVLPARCWA